MKNVKQNIGLQIIGISAYGNRVLTCGQIHIFCINSRPVTEHCIVQEHLLTVSVYGKLIDFIDRFMVVLICPVCSDSVSIDELHFVLPVCRNPDGVINSRIFAEIHNISSAGAVISAASGSRRSAGKFRVLCFIDLMISRNQKRLRLVVLICRSNDKIISRSCQHVLYVQHQIAVF